MRVAREVFEERGIEALRARIPTGLHGAEPVRLDDAAESTDPPGSGDPRRAPQAIRSALSRTYTERTHEGDPRNEEHEGTEQAAERSTGFRLRRSWRTTRSRRRSRRRTRHGATRSRR